MATKSSKICIILLVATALVCMTVYISQNSDHIRTETISSTIYSNNYSPDYVDITSKPEPTCQLTAQVGSLLPEFNIVNSRHDSGKQSWENSWGEYRLGDRNDSCIRHRFSYRTAFNIQLRIYDHFQTGEQWNEILGKYDVCLVTQSSLERLFWLPHQLDHWSGPLSVAILLYSAEEWAIFNTFLCYMDQCHPGYLDRTAIHLAFPTPALCNSEDLSLFEETTSQTIDELIFNEDLSCRDPKDVMTTLLAEFPIQSKRKLALKEIYPQNHIRNIARKGCSASWTLTTDVDIIPVKGMAEKLQTFYEKVNKTGKSSRSKQAFVIPTFELHENATFPQSKKELKEYAAKGLARQFHVQTYAPSQNPTNYLRWLSLRKISEEVYEAYSVTKTPDFYEPFYVSSDAIAAYDERYVGFGFDRNSQVREASWRGWRFSVLDPVFMIHWGLQSKETEISTKKGGVGKNVRREQTKKNAALDKRIKIEIKMKKKLGLL